jgi:N-methylhydantoinase A
MIARARKELAADGAKASTIRHELWADMRYRGQSYEIEVKAGPDFIADFHAAHRRTFGHAAPDARVEAVNLRLRAYAAGPPIAPARIEAPAQPPEPIKRMRTLVGRSYRDVPVYARDSIAPDARLSGPLIVVELSATAYVSPEFDLRCDDYGNLHMELR